MALQVHRPRLTGNGVTRERRAIPYRNLGVGAIMNVFQGMPSERIFLLEADRVVTSLGQPMEVVKTHVCSRKSITMKLLRDTACSQ